MAIIKNFDMDALRRERARNAAAGGSVDLVATLREVAPEVEKLKIGETAKIALPGKNDAEKKAGVRKFVMGITAKLTNLTFAGAPWAGQKYDVVSDPEGGFVYIQRAENGEPIERKRPAPGSRRKKAQVNDSTKVEGNALVTEHA